MLNRFTLTTCLALGLSGQALAQTATEENSSPDSEQQIAEPIKANYQVELLVFSQLYSQTNERWPHDIALVYPDNLLLLDTPQNSRDNNSQDNFSGAGNNDLTDALSGEKKANYLPQAYAFLAQNPAPELFFHSAALRLKAKGSRILFHQSWQQNIDTELDHIAIKGGEQFGEQFELAGNISLRKGRYLHIKTNLWFSQFSQNEEFFAKPWTQLPTVPSVSSLEAKTQAEQQAALGLSDTSNSEPQTQTEPQLAADTEIQSNESETAASDTGLSETPEESETLYSQVHGEYWLKRVVLLQDKRRMRSLENHYIDHPKFGVLVRFTPIKHDSEADAKIAVE